MAVAALLSMCGCALRPEEAEVMMQYQVMRLPTGADPAQGFDEGPWRDAETLELRFHMGAEPAHAPRTQARLCYDDDALYVAFRVEDRYVRAVAERTHDPVYEDSCVELFFTPVDDGTRDYFNIEMNCGGVILMHHGGEQVAERVPLPVADVAEIEVAHSMPRRVDPELQQPVTWTVRYRVPFTMLERHAAVARPGPGVSWRANLFKCADATSHPHWLTWAPVDHPTPRFHVPEDFGRLRFQ